jgi:hypothetical protein
MSQVSSLTCDIILRGKPNKAKIDPQKKINFLFACLR